MRGIHLLQAHVAQSRLLHALARLLEHRRGEIDAGDVAVARIKIEIDAGADADLEHAIAWPHRHAFDRDQPSVMKRGTEDEVVDLGELFVNAVDEVVFDGCYR